MQPVASVGERNRFERVFNCATHLLASMDESSSSGTAIQTPTLHTLTQYLAADKTPSYTFLAPSPYQFQEPTMDQSTHHAFVVAQAELLSTHLTSVLGIRVTKEQATRAIYAMYRPEGQSPSQDAATGVTDAILDAVALAVDAETLLRKARERGANFGKAVAVFTENDSMLERAYSDYAHNYMVSEGDLEFDMGCPVSLSENGAYVQGWKWVDESALATVHSAETDLPLGWD